ncbi:cytochrome P450 [Streptomyces sp. GC420]|uniref:cytochrome P450 family protein n=1 Tax=Streptomyces sp. GC420 TaxID=2697568 RepID=UPI001414DE67|nr:cytochrome P450 [Streptomyces sp. GC420]NBM14291.1 cytochrome P450 [Streptomyces sp. GC420]
MAEPIVSLLNPEFEDDPIGAFARLREKAPLVRIGFPGGPPVWLITRSEEFKAAWSDTRLVTNISNVPGHQGPSIADQALMSLDVPKELLRYFTSNLMLQDGQDHARLRRLVAPAFSVRRITALRPRIEEVSTRLLDAFAEKGSGDLLREYATPLTGAVICELVGIDEPDQPQIRQWMDEYANVDADFTTSALGLFDYTKKLIERRRAEPTDDMISTLVHTTDKNGDRLSEDEIIAMVGVLVNGGYHSTAHFIPNAVLTLLKNPDQLALLRARPEALPHAINELMRIANPIPSAGPRYAAEDMELAGVSICKGDAVTGSLQSVNYDSRVFSEPERCNVERELKRGEGHLAFGAGPHRCIGAALAELEGEVAIDHLFLKRDTLELAVNSSELRYREVIPGGARLFNRFPVRL